jgi:hypothetical protein
VNYGYNKSCDGWDESKISELASALRGVICQFEHTQGRGPYVEVNGPYGGARVRRITWVVNQEKLIDDCDRAYDRVMGEAK